MRTFYVTTSEANKTPGMNVVHRFPPLEIVTTYCCRESQSYTRDYSNIVVRVEAESRSKAKAQVPGAIRVRSEVPEGGWESLERNNVRYVENC